MKSILLEDSLSLSPFSYFAASITALSQPRNDAASAAALATLLSIVLPIVPEGSISPEKAAEAVGILVRVLEDEKDGLVGSTSSARCVVKCLGVLVGFCDLGDWDSVKLPFETLLKWSVDKRPKVRKCALVYLENALKKFQSGTVTKKAGKLILSLLESYTSLEVKGSLRNADGSKRKRQSEPENSDVAHVLSVIRVALPYLSGKITVNVVLKLVELLDGRFSALTRIILNAIEAFLDKVEIEVVTQVAGDIITALTLYVSSKDNPKDSVISAANLLKSALDKNHAGDADKWNKSLSPTVNAIAGLLTQEDDVASQASHILKNLIHHQLFGIESESVTDVVTNDTESNPIASMCSIFMNLLDACAGIPNDYTLDVISVLFLKLGGNSFFYMKNIVLKLAEIYIHADGDNSNTHHLQKCFGCAVVAMGAENVLSLVPISFSIENLTCSNTWLLPILNKYVFGASIGYFMEHIVPIAESIKRASRKVKKSVIGQDLQALARGIWGLLPAFCRHPTDISQSFQSFVKLVLIRLEKDSCMHEDIALALQELVKQNKSLPKSDEASIEPTKHSSDLLLEDNLLEKRRLCSFSKKEANRNLKALSSYSHELLQALMNVFLVSPPEKRSSLKKAISCLASISNPSVTKRIFISSLERFPLPKALTESGEYDLLNASTNHTSCDSSSATDDSQWCLILDLASSVVDGADDDLVGLIFRLLKHALQAEDGIGVREAYFALSCVLEEHPQFCSSKLDELVVLLIGLEPPDDVTSLSNRLSSLHTLLVHALKSNLDVENKKPFLILNEIILMVKDSKEEARKTAYDILLRISSSLGGSCATNPDGPYYRLISMILGYLSGPSPHITSAAISALSVLVFKTPDLCLTVPDVVPSVASLLQTKAVEVIKAVLGFIKVLVSCVQPEDLQNFISVIVDGIIPWSSVSRHHFKSKVTVILEIMIRKCGFPAIKLVTPERYQTFVKKVSLSRRGKTSPKEADSTDAKPNASINGQNKRVRKETQEENGSMLHRNKRRKQNQESRSQGGARNSAGGVTKKTNPSTRAKSRTFDGPGRLKTTNRERFGQASGKPGKRGGAFGKPRKSFGGKNSRKE